MLESQSLDDEGAWRIMPAHLLVLRTSAQMPCSHSRSRSRRRQRKQTVRFHKSEGLLRVVREDQESLSFISSR